MANSLTYLVLQLQFNPHGIAAEESTHTEGRAAVGTGGWGGGGGSLRLANSLTYLVLQLQFSLPGIAAAGPGTRTEGTAAVDTAGLPEADHTAVERNLDNQAVKRG